jgi:hypothetical protein
MVAQWRGRKGIDVKNSKRALAGVAAIAAGG